MIPIVNHQHRYIFFYSAKAACTHLRELYLDLHQDEMSLDELERLDGYHNLNEVFPLDWSHDHSGYNRFLFTRNPFSRIVSAFLDQYVYQRSEGVSEMLGGAQPNTFLDFLTLLHQVPDGQRDTHFQSQSYINSEVQLITQHNLRYRWLRRLRSDEYPIRHCYDVSQIGQFLPKFYRKVFAENADAYALVTHLHNHKPKRNSLLYSETHIEGAATLSTQEIDDMVFAPRPESFLADSNVRELVSDIYRKDFEHFAYSSKAIPKTTRFGAIAMLPEGFDWQLYIEMNPDVEADPLVYNERSAIRHYLEFSPLDDYQRAYNLIAPAGFDWQRYVELNPDLSVAGIASQAEAVRHYQMFGRREKRSFK